MSATMKSHMILDRFKELINDYYTEPTDEEIFAISSFLAIISDDSPVRTLKLCHFKEKGKKIVNSGNKRTRH